MRILVALFLAGMLCASDKRGVTPEDYFLFANVADPQISPDGRLVAYTITHVDAEQNRRNSEIWLVPFDGSAAPRQLTSSIGATSPRWSPDGKALAFLGGRPAQVQLLPMDGGEARRITSLKNGVTAFAWSPDGTRLVCVSRTGPAPAERSTDTRHYLASYYKFNGRSFFDPLRSHLWVVSAHGGDARQITSGDQRNDLDPQWSPDGARVAFASERTDTEPGAVDEIRTVSASGGEMKQIADRHEGDRSPRWSPDGKWIAYLAASKEDESQAIWIAGAEGGVSRQAARRLDYVPASLSWRDDGGALLFVSGWKGEQHLFSLDVRTGDVKAVTAGARYVTAPAIHYPSSRMVYTANDIRQLDELYASALDGSAERRLTHTNDDLLGRLELPEIERLPYKSADGWQVDGFFMKPVGWQEGRKYPMVLSIHGGPAGQYGMGWYHEFQVYTSRGWAVFFANPRGSTGYGVEFQRGVKMEWGGKAYQDLMNGVDAALAKYPWIDRERLGVTGGSYGGFMTNWIVSHTDRFKAAVTLRSISNFISDDGTRDGAYGHKRDFGGDIFENYEFYWRSSPLRYAKEVKTPILILHSDDDQRVPLEQGEQWFRALQHFHVPSEFVIFPRENHDLTRNGEPKHLVESLKWQVYWFDRYLNGNSRAVPPDAPLAQPK
ncbi:MAG TPA: S9 family peptidase [Candidatus Acidoferrales bacterium]|nr:S9 family peptidase [Candidatus Acidoferrales bacterium]